MRNLCCARAEQTWARLEPISGLDSSRLESLGIQPLAARTGSTRRLEPLGASSRLGQGSGLTSYWSGLSRFSDITTLVDPLPGLESMGCGCVGYTRELRHDRIHKATLQEVFPYFSTYSMIHLWPLSWLSCSLSSISIFLHKVVYLCYQNLTFKSFPKHSLSLYRFSIPNSHITMKLNWLTLSKI